MLTSIVCLGSLLSACGKTTIFIFQDTSWSGSEIIKESYSWAKQYVSTKWGKTNDPQGLSQIVERGYDSVLIQSDCLEAVIAIQKGSSEGSNSALVRRIHQILLHFKQWDIKHISREENQEADHLIKLVQHRDYGLYLIVISLLEGMV
ncbi:hypothetical protein PVK06_030504 [Gossypium arboreum]|uniref:RNase H type-1 domain-containing protein n=1 Tax=Gossypium arboreum TaxID=29729 RepID=A0ABR0NNI4_GOSAR|nr:hypothetical protein PVK06_030504 [Gossypium arboreum]